MGIAALLRLPNGCLLLSLESSIERELVRKSPVPLIKLNTRSGRGWPDRFALLPGGRVFWIELKRPGGKTSKMQDHIHGVLRFLGHDVGVFDSVDDALGAIRERAGL